MCIERVHVPNSAYLSKQWGSIPSSRQALIATSPLIPPPIMATRFLASSMIVSN